MACSEDARHSDPVTPTAETGGTEDTSAPAGQRQGQVLITHRLPVAGSAHSAHVRAVFADSLGGMPLPSLCVADRQSCWPETPEPGGAVLAPDPPHDLDDAVFDFNGFTMEVDHWLVPFLGDFERDAAWYALDPEDGPSTLGEPLTVAFAGEWERFEAAALELPPALLFTEPDPAELIEVAPGETVQFRWVPAAGTRLWLELEVAGRPVVLRDLADDGEELVALDDLGPIDEEEVAVLRFLRVQERTEPVGTNVLELLGAEVQEFRAAPMQPTTCRAWQEREPTSTSGLYTLWPDRTAPPRPVWCDMETDGGGWTLVAASSAPLQDRAGPWHDGLTSLEAADTARGVWSGLRPALGATADVRFTCRVGPLAGPWTVDLSFYDVPWYDEFTTGGDAASCFNEGNGAGYDQPAPSRRNNLSGELLPVGDDWDRGFLEGEDACGDTMDFTIDFDDRGMDGDQSDGTDWGQDDGLGKCGVSDVEAKWFIFARER